MIEQERIKGSGLSLSNEYRNRFIIRTDMAMINPLVIAVNLTSEDIPTTNASISILDHSWTVALFFELIFPPMFSQYLPAIFSLKPSAVLQNRQDITQYPAYSFVTMTILIYTRAT